jgi:hypothetical protein
LQLTCFKAIIFLKILIFFKIIFFYDFNRFDGLM